MILVYWEASVPDFHGTKALLPLPKPGSTADRVTGVCDHQGLSTGALYPSYPTLWGTWWSLDISSLYAKVREHLAESSKDN